jgi:hypothetical protein
VGYGRGAAGAALFVVAQQQKVIRVLVQDADPILETLVVGLMLVTVYPGNARPEESGRHFKGNAGPRTRLVKKIEQPLADQRSLELGGWRPLELGSRRKKDRLQPLARELASVEDVIEMRCHPEEVRRRISAVSRTRDPSPERSEGSRRLASG